MDVSKKGSQTSEFLIDSPKWFIDGGQSFPMGSQSWELAVLPGRSCRDPEGGRSSLSEIIRSFVEVT